MKKVPKDCRDASDEDRLVERRIKPAKIMTKELPFQIQESEEQCSVSDSEDCEPTPQHKIVVTHKMSSKKQLKDNTVPNLQQYVVFT